MRFLRILNLSASRAVLLLLLQLTLYIGIACQPFVFGRALKGSAWLFLALPVVLAVLRSLVSWTEQKTMLKIKYGLLDKIHGRLLSADVKEPLSHTVFLTQYAQQLTQSVYALDFVSTVAALILFLTLSLIQWTFAALAAASALFLFAWISARIIKKVGDLYQRLLKAERVQAARAQELESQRAQIEAAGLQEFGVAYLGDQRQAYAGLLRERGRLQILNQSFMEGFPRLFALLILLLVPADSSATGLSLSLSALVLSQLTQNLMDNYRVLRFTAPVIDKVEQFFASTAKLHTAGLVRTLPNDHVSGICIENADEMKSVVESLRANPEVEVVPREPVLFNASIGDNILCHLTRDEERLKTAVFLSGLDLPLELQVGPKGSAISGGQRARVALARALYAQPSRVVLAQTADSLDWKTWELLLARWRAASTAPSLLVLSASEAGLRLNKNAAVEDAGTARPVSGPAVMKTFAPAPSRASLFKIFSQFFSRFSLAAVAIVLAGELLLWAFNRAAGEHENGEVLVYFAAALLAAVVCKQILIYVFLNRRVEEIFRSLAHAALYPSGSEAMKRLTSDFFDLQMNFPGFSLSLLQAGMGILIFLGWSAWRQPVPTLILLAIAVGFFLLALNAYRVLQQKRRDFIFQRDTGLALAFESYELAGQLGWFSKRREQIHGALSKRWNELYAAELSLIRQRQKMVVSNQALALAPFLLSGTWLVWAGPTALVDLVFVLMSYEISRSLGRLLNDYVGSEQMLFSLSSIFNVTAYLPKKPVHSAMARFNEVRHMYEGREDFQFGPLNLQLERGKAYLVTGATGSGKSTFLRLLQGQISPGSGVLDLAPSFSVAQNLPTFPVTVQDYLRLQKSPCAAASNLAARTLSELTRWERIQLELSRAEVSNAAVILLDEITAGLSEGEIRGLLSRLKQFKLNAAVVMVSHQELPPGHFDHHLRFDKGRMYAG